jgi:hypothetical protein
MDESSLGDRHRGLKSMPPSKGSIRMIVGEGLQLTTGHGLPLPSSV